MGNLAHSCAFVRSLSAMHRIACRAADGGYAGDKLQCAMLNLDPSPQIEIVRRPSQATGFVVVARRWVVERTFAWLGRCRRLAKDWESTIQSSEAWLLIASIRRATRHVAIMLRTGQEF